MDSNKISLFLAAAIISVLQSGVESLLIDWDIPADGKRYNTITAEVGDTIIFDYTFGHNVVLHPSGTCDLTQYDEFIGNAGPTEYTFDKEGLHTFACDVSDGVHCKYGQIIDVNVIAASSLNENETGGDQANDENDQGYEEDKGNKEMVDEVDEDEVLAKYSHFFNPEEEMGVWEFKMKDYKLPHNTTTYVDFYFNAPEMIETMVHIVAGDVIISQPKHIHHFVLTGCTESIDPSLEGLAVDNLDITCSFPLGGWALGGDIFGGVSSDSGFIFGAAIKGLKLNVHYTDGDRVDLNYPNDGTHAIATDGIRVLYTPTLRPKTILQKPLLNIIEGPPAMNMPPNVARYFYTKTCTVKPRDMGNMGVNPGEFYISAVRYHAHLIGREMYMSLLPRNNDAQTIDLESKDLWLNDYQVTYSFYDDNQNRTFVKLYPGDKLQATCVYDSTSREDTTYFGPSTYDEMCISSVLVLVDTPATANVHSPILLKEMISQIFQCAIDDSSDIWSGSLEADEDARDIWKEHPMTEADCTFPVDSTGARPNFDVNCSSKDDNEVETSSENIDILNSSGIEAMSSFLLYLCSCFTFFQLAF